MAHPRGLSPFWKQYAPVLKGLAEQGWTDEEIAASGKIPGASVSMVTNARRRIGVKGGENYRTNRIAKHAARPADAPTNEEAPETSKVLTREDISRILSLDDLLAFFKVDRESWDVNGFKVNKWEQASGNKKTGITVTPLYQVSANLVRSANSQVAIAERIIADMLSDAQGWGGYHKELADAVRMVAQEKEPLFPDPVMMELALYDPHIGMLAWGEEVGEDYDTKIAVSDYLKALSRLLQYVVLYNVERILLVVGNDFLHVDGPAGPGARGGATAAGTQQDIDTRLAKMFTSARRAATTAIDMCATVAPVTVVCVPGNHDPKQTYAMGEVLSAWYRESKRVHVIYGPQKRFFYPDPEREPQEFKDWGLNAWMFTHGEEYARKRDSLPLIFSQEAPPELWVRSKSREIHTGHNHIGKEGAYVPTRDLDESRAVRTRSLRALTTEDSWHYGSGYKHARGATAMAWLKEGGLAGLHEVSL